MAINSEPFEILAGPADIYTASDGTAFPDVDEAPAAGWTRIANALQIPEDGVVISGDGTEEPVYSLGGTGSRKGFRTRQEVHVRFKVRDATVEAYSAAMNGAAITTTAAGAGTPGTKKIEISMPGGAIATKALLVRVLQSPYGDGMAAQWEFPRAYNMGHPETAYTKGEPVALDFDWFVMDDSSGNKGHYVGQTAPAI
ncbi:MAG TPA: hypothetical protein VGR85_09005 [Candidatus Limnocylindria bacterium]|jgi:hypothetical protein|nr:hypothetical protein [Candidatus Limnocylindria bacterium]